MVGNIVPPGAAASVATSLMTLPTPPTALLGLNRGISIGIVKAVLDSKAPPVIVGLDDFDLADAPGISVIDRCPAELGRQAALLAMQRISKPDSPLTRLLLPPQFVPRAKL